MEMAPAAKQREVDSDLIRAEAALIAARLNRAHADLVDLVVRLLDDELWAGGGILSPEHWLVLRVGLSPSRAHEVTRLARRQRELPRMAAALRDGQLSIEQAAVVSRYVPAAHDDSATGLAVHATVPQLRRALAKYQFATPTPTPTPPDSTSDSTETHSAMSSADQAGDASPGPTPGTDASEPVGSAAWAAKAPTLSMGHADGRFSLSFTAPSDVGALVEQAILEAKDALFRAANTAAGDADPVTADSATPASLTRSGQLVRVTCADALLEVANRSLSGIESTSRASKYRVYVHLSTDGAWINGRGAIPPVLAEKFACDGVVQPVWETDGVPVSVGRAQRITPDRTRRLVEDRDGGCRFPGCAATRHVEVHHLDHWAHGGATDLHRMLALCDRHHDAHHRREFTMSGDPTRLDGVVFRTAGGVRLGPPPAPPPQATPTTHQARDPGDRRLRSVPATPFHPSDDGEAATLRPYSGPTGERLSLYDVVL